MSLSNFTHSQSPVPHITSARPSPFSQLHPPSARHCLRHVLVLAPQSNHIINHSTRHEKVTWPHRASRILSKKRRGKKNTKKKITGRGRILRYRENNTSTSRCHSSLPLSFVLAPQPNQQIQPPSVSCTCQGIGVGVYKMKDRKHEKEANGKKTKDPQLHFSLSVEWW